ELERQIGMRGSPLAQVDLYRVRPPLAFAATDYDEVHRKAAKNAFAREAIADLPRLGRDQARVLGVRREDAAEVALAAGPAQELIMGREQLYLAGRRHAQLNAGAAKFGSADALLDHAAHLLQLLEVGLELQALDLEDHLAGTALEVRPLRRRARRGK